MKDTPSPVDAWMPLWIGDYLADTLGLTTEQHGAYLLLLMAYWRNRGPLDDDNEAFAGITRLSWDRWMEQRHRLARFFRVEDGRWHHKRADAEREAAEVRSGKAHVRAANAAAARWARDGANRPPQDDTEDSSSNASSMQQAMLEECPSPSPSPSPAVKATAGEASPPPVPVKPARARKAKPAPESVPIILPDWLPPAVWDEWCAYRNRGPKRAEWTDLAKAKALGVLATCYEAGYPPSQVVDNAIQSGYTGLYRPKEQPHGSPPSRPHPASSSPADRVLQRITDRAPDDPGQPARG